MIFIAQTTQPISPWQMAAPIIGAVALTVGALALTLNYLNFRRNRYPSVSISGVFSSYTMDSNDFVLLFDVESYGADIHDFRAVLRCPERKLGMIDLTFAPHALPSDETKQIPNPFKNGQRLRLELTLSTSAGSDVDSIHLFAREAMLAGTAAIIVEGNGRQLGVIAHDDKKMVKQFEFYRNCANASDENGPSSPLGPPSQPLTSNPVEKISPSDAAKYIVEQLKAEIEHNRSWPTKIMAFYVTICFGLATAIVSLKGRSEKIDYSPLAAKTFVSSLCGPFAFFEHEANRPPLIIALTWALICLAPVGLHLLVRGTVTAIFAAFGISLWFLLGLGLTFIGV